MGDLLKSLIRTIVPVIVGLILSVAVKAGLEIDPGQLTQVVDAIVIGLYYALVRFGESKHPGVGWLLGLPVSPQYAPTPRETTGTDTPPLT